MSRSDVGAVGAGRYGRAVDETGTVRVGDADREAAVAALGEHYGAGRLDLCEYDSRVRAVTAALSRADLVMLFTDLPSPHPPAVAPTLMAEPRPGALPKGLRKALADDGLLFLAEDVAAEMAYRRYRAPGHRIFRHTVRVRGAVAVTRQRLVVWAAAAKRVDLAFADARWDAALTVAVDRSGRLRIITRVSPFPSRPLRPHRVPVRHAARSRGGRSRACVTLTFPRGDQAGCREPSQLVSGLPRRRRSRSPARWARR